MRPADGGVVGADVAVGLAHQPVEPADRGVVARTSCVGTAAQRLVLVVLGRGQRRAVRRQVRLDGAPALAQRPAQAAQVGSLAGDGGALSADGAAGGVDPVAGRDQRRVGPLVGARARAACGCRPRRAGSSGLPAAGSWSAAAIRRRAGLARGAGERQEEQRKQQRSAMPAGLQAASGVGGRPAAGRAGRHRRRGGRPSARTARGALGDARGSPAPAQASAISRISGAQRQARGATPVTRRSRPAAEVLQLLLQRRLHAVAAAIARAWAASAAEILETPAKAIFSAEAEPSGPSRTTASSGDPANSPAASAARGPLR